MTLTVTAVLGWRPADLDVAAFGVQAARRDVDDSVVDLRAGAPGGVAGDGGRLRA